MLTTCRRIAPSQIAYIPYHLTDNRRDHLLDIFRGSDESRNRRNRRHGSSGAIKDGKFSREVDVVAKSPFAGSLKQPQ